MEHLLNHFQRIDDKHDWNGHLEFDDDDYWLAQTRFAKDTKPDNRTTSSGHKLGDRWTDEEGNTCYVTSHIGGIFDVTVYEDGSQAIHFGGPCGSLYIDKYGNS